MPRYFIHMAYNGSRYHGYQIQPHSDSVQQTVEQCLSLKLGHPASITGCGRTDTGVHARNYYARFDAVSRTYHYYLTRTKNPFHTQDAYYFYGDLDVAKMQEAANLLFDYEDFTSFSKVHTQVKTNNCKIMEARWFEENGLLVFRIKADRFLRNMVRAIVGTLLEIGKGQMTLDEFRAVIERKDRCEAGTSVPAHALFLEEVEYPNTISPPNSKPNN